MMSKTCHFFSRILLYYNSSGFASLFYIFTFSEPSNVFVGLLKLTYYSPAFPCRPGTVEWKTIPSQVTNTFEGSWHAADSGRQLCRTVCIVPVPHIDGAALNILLIELEIYFFQGGTYGKGAIWGDLIKLLRVQYRWTYHHKPKSHSIHEL